MGTLYSLMGSTKVNGIDDGSFVHRQKHPERLSEKDENGDSSSSGIGTGSEPFSESLPMFADRQLPDGVPARPDARTLNPLSELGRGTFGVVMRVRDESNGRDVAEKSLFPPKRSKDETTFAQDAEKEMLAIHWQHPHIVRILWASWPTVNNPDVVIGMEYLAGGTLAKRMKDHPGAWSHGSTVRIVKQVLNALDYLQREHGIVHRDIKPDNILFISQGSRALKIGDFGTALAITDRDAPTFVGTPGRIAPELFGYADEDKEPPSFEKCDVWSVGVLLHELATGERDLSRFGQATHTALPFNLMLILKFQGGANPELLQFSDDKSSLQSPAKKMLRSEPTTRWSIRRAHAAFQDHSEPKPTESERKPLALAPVQKYKPRLSDTEPPKGEGPAIPAIKKHAVLPDILKK